MSITDELREFIDSLACHKDTRDMMRRIADRIDKEHAEAVADALQLRGGEDRWVELPVDADGVPIHVGDELTDGKVARLLICDDEEENSVYVYESPHVIKQIYCYEVVHRKPDSWECIIADALKFAGNGGVPVGARFADYTEEFVERCRRLAGEDE